MNVSWPIDVKVPRDDGSTLSLRFRALLLPLDEVDPRLALVALFRRQSLALFLRKHFLGWEDLRGENGAALPFSIESRDAMLNNPTIARAIWVALLDLSQRRFQLRTAPRRPDDSLH